MVTFSEEPRTQGKNIIWRCLVCFAEVDSMMRIGQYDAHFGLIHCHVLIFSFFKQNFLHDVFTREF